MKPAELQQALRAVEPAAVLVTPRVLEAIVRQTYGISALLGTVPQQATFIADRQLLFRHVEQEDLALESDQVLPSTVILLSWPTQEDLQHTPAQALLLKYWQRLFHASIHLELDRLCVEGKLTLADIRQRMRQIGDGAFEEIRKVLIADRYILEEADERRLYLEFAALFLELYFFAPSMLPSMFPSLRDPEAVKNLLTYDVDAQAIFQRTRLQGAGDPIAFTPNRAGEAHEYYWKLVADSDQAVQAGNVVRAAVQRRRAARVAPAALGFDTRNQALELLYGLLARLRVALELSDAEMIEWRKDIPTLLDKADQGSRAPEASLLYDLQRACLDFEQELYSVDLLKWLKTLGKVPIRRPLPSLRLVQLTRHIKNATQRITLARLSDDDRDHLGNLLETALARCEQRLRERFRPILITALEDVGLSPRNAPERVAFHKMVEETIDRVLAHGFVTFSDLRDIISGNQLKLADLSDPQDFLRGDPLLRLDRRLATLLDGVYKPGEIYLRWLERFTSWNFGTAIGRLITLWVSLPIIFGFVLIKVPLIVLEALKAPELSSEAFYSLWAVAAVFMVAFMHSTRLRTAVNEVGLKAVAPMERLVVDLPVYLVKHPSLKKFLTSWPFQFFVWYIFQPALLCAILIIVIPGATEDFVWWGLLFLAANILINSRFGRQLGEAFRSIGNSFVELLRGGLIPGLVRMIVFGFQHIVYLFEALLFAVDDWLRFRGGESQAATVTRAILSALWFPVSYLFRFMMVVLIEPGLNPLKFPICSLAAKVLYPMYLIIELEPRLIDLMSPYLGVAVARGLVLWFLFWSPDVFGFLFWEMKENWKLYRSNRPKELRAVAFGPHAETLPRLLRPGFHSGTAPKIFRKLRRAERAALKSGNWSVVRTQHRHLREIRESLESFLEREFLALLRQDPAWLGVPLAVQHVHLAGNRIDVDLRIGAAEDPPLSLRFEERGGWLVAGVYDGQVLEQLNQRQRSSLTNALAGLYKLAGADLIDEQLRQKLPVERGPWSYRQQGLVFWQDERRSQGVYYDIRKPQPRYFPMSAMNELVSDWPALDDSVVFAHQPIAWDAWVQSWHSTPSGLGGQLLAAYAPILASSPLASPLNSPAAAAPDTSRA